MQSFKKAIYKNNRIRQEVSLPPVVDAGQDFTVPYNESETVLEATTNIPSSDINLIVWTKVSGPGTINITDSDNLITLITGLEAGTYIFRIEVTNTQGLTGSDEVIVDKPEGTVLELIQTGSSDNSSTNIQDKTENSSLSIDPALLSGESLTLNFSVDIGIFRSTTTEVSAYGYVIIKRNGTTATITRNGVPGSSGSFFFSEAEMSSSLDSLNESGSIVVQNNDNIEIELIAYAQVSNSEDAINANATINFNSASINLSTKGVISLPASRSLFVSAPGGVI